MQSAGGLKAVRMGRNPAHGVKRHRPPRHGCMEIATKIRPGLLNLNRLLKRHVRQFSSQSPDTIRRNATARSHRFGGIVIRQIFLSHMLKHRPVALICRPQIRLHAFAIPRRRRAGSAINHKGLAFGVLRDQPFFRPIFHHQQRRIGVAREILQIDLARLQQAMDQRQDQQPIRPRCDAQPVIGHSIIPGANRVNANHPRAARLQLAQPDFDRVAVMIFRHPKQHEQLGALPIGRAKLPERTADGVNPARRHVHRTKPTMRRIIRRAKRLRPPTGKALRLIAPGEKRQLFGGCFAQWLHPGHRQSQSLIPGNLLKRAGPTRPHPLQRRAQPRRRRHLHDTARALGTEHALVDRMVAIALDIADPALFQMHIDAAAAGAHIAGGLADFVRNRGRGVNLRLNSHLPPLRLTVNLDGSFSPNKPDCDTPLRHSPQSRKNFRPSAGNPEKPTRAIRLQTNPQQRQSLGRDRTLLLGRHDMHGNIASPSQARHNPPAHKSVILANPAGEGDTV